MSLGRGSCRNFRSDLDRNFFDDFNGTAAVVASSVASAAYGLTNLNLTAAARCAVATMASVGVTSAKASEQSAMASAATVTTTAVTTAVATTIVATAVAIAAATVAMTTAVANTMTTLTAVASAVAKQTTTSTMTSPSCIRFVLISRQGDRQNRKENGDSPENCSIHLAFLQN